ncbi:MAG: cytochrome c biogenesis protein ResB [Nitrospirae bacterium]|nr:cytochrome c biogenesis protein ResB [Nitrospirota bacterium]
MKTDPAINFMKNIPSVLYKLFTSIHTSIIILLSIVALSVVGAFFPQKANIEGMNIKRYIDTGGKLAPLVETLGLLDVFNSPLFIALAVLLLIALAACSYDRLSRKLLKIKKTGRSLEALKNHPEVLIFEETDLEERLKENKFQLKTEYQNESSPVRVYEKGVPAAWLSLLLHVLIFLCILGFFINTLFAFENVAYLFLNEPKKITIFSEKQKWNKLLKRMGGAVSGRNSADEYILTIKNIRSEYHQVPVLHYPDEDKIYRLSRGLGIKEFSPPGERLAPQKWASMVEIKKPNSEILDTIYLEPNKTFSGGGFSLHHVTPLHRVKFKANDEIVDIFSGHGFRLKGVDGEFGISRILSGTVFKPDGSTETLTPATTVYYFPDEIPLVREDIVDIRLGEKKHAKDFDFEILEIRDGFLFFYSKNPSLWLVGITSVLALLVLSVRCFCAWYRIELASENNTTYVLLKTRGALADKEMLLKKMTVIPDRAMHEA